MAKYRKISPRIWNDAKVRKLTDKGKLVFLFLLTHPAMTPFGAIRANAPGLAYELGWSRQAFGKALQELCELGMAVLDDGLIWFPNFLKYNQPESPNVIRSWAGAFEDLPECALRLEIYRVLERLAARLGKGFREAFMEAFGEEFIEEYQEGLPEGYKEDLAQGYAEGLAEGYREGLPEGYGEGLRKGMPNQEQEQEQDKEENYTPPDGGASRTHTSPPDEGVSRTHTLAPDGIAADGEAAPSFLACDLPSLKNEGEGKNVGADEGVGEGGKASAGKEGKQPADGYRTRKGRLLTGKRLAAFERFWKAFDFCKGKADAADAWLAIPELTDSLVERICGAARIEAANRGQIEARGGTPKWAQGWIRSRRWEDYEEENTGGDYKAGVGDKAGTGGLSSGFSRQVEVPLTEEEREKALETQRRLEAERKMKKLYGEVGNACAI